MDPTETVQHLPHEVRIIDERPTKHLFHEQKQARNLIDEQFQLMPNQNCLFQYTFAAISKFLKPN